MRQTGLFAITFFASIVIVASLIQNQDDFQRKSLKILPVPRRVAFALPTSFQQDNSIKQDSQQYSSIAMFSQRPNNNSAVAPALETYLFIGKGLVAVFASLGVIQSLLNATSFSSGLFYYLIRMLPILAGGFLSMATFMPNAMMSASGTKKALSASTFGLLASVLFGISGFVTAGTGNVLWMLLPVALQAIAFYQVP